ncbi:MAG TPA: hypothetical protein VGZ71_10815 [Puia sp.]|nr:hypothetical protein [Puia sp.]
MKIYGILFLSLLSFSFLDCTKTVTQVQEVNQAFSATYTLAPANWSTTDNGLSYSATLQVPALDDIILQSGGVIVYLSFDNGTNFEAIPEVFGGIAYGSVHSKGQVLVDLHATNGGTISAPGGQILAKVVLLDAKPL